MRTTMKNLLLMNVLMFCFNFVMLSQPVVTAGTDSDGTTLECGLYCNQNITIEVPLANLDLYEPMGSLNQEYFPDDYPEMYLEVYFQGQAYRFLVEDFVFQETVAGGVNVYVAKFEILFNICEFCESQGPGSHSVNIEMQLTTLEGGNYVEYPACDYVNPDDIFSCLFTSVSCSSIGACDNSILTEGGGALTVLCNNDCEFGEQGLGGSSAHQSLLVSILTNPVDYQLTVRSVQPIENGRYRIFNSDGKLVLHENNVSLKGDKRINLPNDLNAGIYYLQVFDGFKYSIDKFIKL